MQVAQLDARLVGRQHRAKVVDGLARDEIAHQLARRLVVAATQHIGAGFKPALQVDARQRVCGARVAAFRRSASSA